MSGLDDFGKLSVASNASAPLLVVFGGIDVGGRPSGKYMWDYMNGIKDRFHIFVAANTSVNGTQAYNLLMSALQAQGINPSRQILYLFSGGYRPGMNLLTNRGAAPFSSIYLVDIWMGNDESANFYKSLADGNAAKITYVYTAGAANNPAARDYIANKVGPRAILFKGPHMDTNKVAVARL